MKFPIDFLSVVIICATCNTLLLCVVLWFSKNGIRKSNRLMSVVMLVSAYSIFPGFYYSSGLFQRLPSIAWTHLPLLFLITPLIYFYVIATTRPDFRFRPWTFLHFAPVVLAIIYLWPYYSLSTHGKIELLKQIAAKEVYGAFYATNLWIFVTFQAIIYLAGANQELLAFKARIVNEVAETTSSNIRWMRAIISISLVIYCSVAILGIFVLGGKVMAFVYNAFFLILALMEMAVGYVFLSHPLVNRQYQGTAADDLKKYIHSTLSGSQIEEYKQMLLSAMDQKKLYLSPDITLSKLADELSVSRNHISQLLNEHFNQNFYDFINTYRIEYVKNELRNDSNRHMNILELAYTAGFNSKTTFNISFKKATGVTPTQYRKHL